MAPKPRVTRGQIIEEINKGKSLSEAAAALGISRQLANYHLKKTGGDYRSPQEIARDSLPWDVDHDKGFHKAWPYQHARMHAMYTATRGAGMSDEKLRALRQWYERLRDFDLVLEYDPSIEPHRGVATGGWAYRPRLKKDGNLLVRVNNHTHLTREGKVIWKMPPEDRWPKK